MARRYCQVDTVTGLIQATRATGPEALLASMPVPVGVVLIGLDKEPNAEAILQRPGRWQYLNQVWSERPVSTDPKHTDALSRLKSWTGDSTTLAAAFADFLIVSGLR